MYPVKDSFNIVLVGAWNPSIFNQAWILNNISESDTAELSLAFPIDDATAPRKIGFEGLNIYPGRKQLLLSPDNTDSDGIKLCANRLSRILDLLIHTPVGNCGINFHFEETNNLEKTLEVLNLSDRNNIDSSTYTLLSSNATRKFQIQDGPEMNFSVMDSPNGITLSFNFHHDTTDLNAVKELITEEYVEALYNRAIVFCRDVYGLEIEEGDNHE